MIVLKVVNFVLAIVLVALSGYKLYKFRSYDEFENKKMMVEVGYWSFWVLLNLFNLFA